METRFDVGGEMNDRKINCHTVVRATLKNPQHLGVLDGSVQSSIKESLCKLQRRPRMATIAPLFGVVIPGRPLITEFQVLGSTKAITVVENPQMVSEITFFLLPSTTIPPGFGAILYYSLSPFTEWTLIGSVDPSKPSGIFRTGWVTDEAVMASPVVQLGVSLEPLETIRNLEITYSGVEDRFTFAHKIARDLFQYMTSFCSGDSSSQGMMVVPMNIFDRWMERFERKYRIDPNFMLKS